MHESNVLGGGRVARILLVEDDPDDVVITKRAFAHAKIGNPITVVETGEAALELLYRCGSGRDPEAVDLILLDLGLPKIDGREVMREIWSSKRLRGIPIIVLTGSSRENDLIEAYKGGVVAFLHKPVEVERLLTAIGDLNGFQLLITRSTGAT